MRADAMCSRRSRRLLFAPNAPVRQAVTAKATAGIEPSIAETPAVNSYDGFSPTC